MLNKTMSKEITEETNKIKKGKKEAFLKVKDLNVYYGKIRAIRDVSFHVNRGEIVTLIGANGAGKTTILQALSGLLNIRTGEIIYAGNAITKVPAHKIVHMGLAQVPEGRRIFRELSVEDNLIMGAYRFNDKAQMQKDLEEAFERFPRLKERRKQLAGTLSGGEQQMLAIARALMSHPDILLLDEPSMGLSPLLVQEIFRIIRDINEQGMTILLVEQNAQMALFLADRAYVLETGKIILEGNAKDLLEDNRVKSAYLGS